MMLGNTVWESTLQRLVPAAHLSRVSAYDWFGGLSCSALGMIVWGPIADTIGLSTALWAASAGIVATTLALVSVPAVRQVRR